MVTRFAHPLTPPAYDSVLGDSKAYCSEIAGKTQAINPVPSPSYKCHSPSSESFSDASDSCFPEQVGEVKDSGSSGVVGAESELDRLIGDIKTIMGPSSGLDASDVDVEHLMETIKAYVSDDKDWSKYAFVDDGHNYTRNGVDDINSKANLLILVWTPGKGSAIHDHANAHCIVKMLSGTLRETLYEMPSNSTPDCKQELHVKKVSDYSRDQVSYMSDTIGLHSMENPGTVPAVSLHLYTPPFAAKFGCNVYDVASGTSQHVSMSTLYSDRGKKVVGSACSC